MKNGIGNWLDCADVISVSQISRSERATTRFAVGRRAADSVGTECSAALLATDGTSSFASTAGASDAARREQTNASANKQVTHVVLGKCGRTRQHAQSHEI